MKVNEIKIANDTCSYCGHRPGFEGDEKEVRIISKARYLWFVTAANWLLDKGSNSTWDNWIKEHKRLEKANE